MHIYHALYLQKHRDLQVPYFWETFQRRRLDTIPLYHTMFQGFPLPLRVVE